MSEIVPIEPETPAKPPREQITSVYYDLHTGEIVASNRMLSDAFEIQVPPPGCGHVIHSEKFRNFEHAKTSFFVAAGKVTARAAMQLIVSKSAILADGKDSVTISGIPTAAVVEITGAFSAGPEIVEDGELVITSTQPGAIEIEISLPPTHETWRTLINAT